VTRLKNILSIESMTKKKCEVSKEKDQKDTNNICIKCGRITIKEKHLCKPKEINK